MEKKNVVEFKSVETSTRSGLLRVDLIWYLVTNTCHVWPDLVANLS